MSETGPTILPVRPGSVTEKDRAALRRAGVIVVEHENPEELRLLKASGPEVDAGDMLRAAVQALTGSGFGNIQGARETFIQLLSDSMNARAQAAP